MIVGDLSHIHVYEQGGSAQVWSNGGYICLLLRITSSFSQNCI